MSERATSVVSIETPDGAMPAVLWLPESGTGPGIAVFQEIFGVTDYIRGRCSDLADLGYVVCAPEIYWRLGLSALPETGERAISDAIGVSQRLNWSQAVEDGMATVEHLRGRLEVTGKVGVLGFCLGGGLAFNVAADGRPDALVSYYGSGLPGLLNRCTDVTVPSLHHFGLADRFFPPEVVATIESAVTAAGGRFETYPGADHAFDNPQLELHHPDAAEAAWGVTRRFLAEVLPV
jgi:carboxymethylenebutenolidase